MGGHREANMSCRVPQPVPQRRLLACLALAIAAFSLPPSERKSSEDTSLRGLESLASAIVPESSEHHLPEEELITQDGLVTPPSLLSESQAQADSVRKYDITNNNFENDTPAPFPDVPPAPGSMNLARGIDRFDRSRGQLPVFQWTWKKFVKNINTLNNGDKSGLGHNNEIWVDGQISAVPDQLYMSGPSAYCESAASAQVKIVSSSQEMGKMESDSVSGGYDREIDVSAEAQGVSASTTLKTQMEMGSSTSSGEYEKAASAGETRSAFATIIARNYDAFITDTTSFSPEFDEEYEKLTKDSSDAALRSFVNRFGTDYLRSAKLGGKVSQQTSAQAESQSSISNSELSKQSSTSFQHNFVKLGTDESKSQESTTQTSSATQTTTHKARFEGGLPSNDWMEWCQSTAKHPYPISFQTFGIAGLIEEHKKNSALARKMEAFLRQRESKRAECAKDNSGMVLDKATGECVAAPCAAGSESVSCKNEPGCDKKTNPEQKKCKQCDKGKYQPMGENTCTDCPKGKYSDVLGMANMCKACPSGTTSDAGEQSCPYLTGQFQMSAAYTSLFPNGASIRPADSGSRGDNSYPSDGVKWAVLDMNTPANKVTLEHLSGDEYYVKAGGMYLGFTQEGDDEHCSGGLGWGYFAMQPKALSIIRNTGGRKGSYSFRYQGIPMCFCNQGDDDKEDGTLWIEFTVSDTAVNDWNLDYKGA